MAEIIEEENFSAVISWEGITVNTIPRGQAKSRTILSNSYGCVKPGEFLAVMGPSGAGKTTLLNCLSNRRQKNLKIESGLIYLNRIPITSVEYSSMIGFVPQDDILFTSMTPREILSFAALMAINIDKHHLHKLVDQTIKDLGLSSCADTLVGGPFSRGLSGGEKKRTSVGIELISNPCVLFLDEPTTGLDSFIALSIIQLIGNIAKTHKRTIIATIHQPSSQIFQCFDRLLLLSQGQTVYMGKAQKAIPFFDDLGYLLPKNYNPADHFLAVISENTFKFPEYVQNYSVIDEKPSKPHVVEKPSFFKALRLLTWRVYLDMLRNPLNLAGKVFKVLLYSFMCSIVFWKLGYDQQGVYDRESCIFVLMCTFSIEAHLSVLQTFQMQKLVFLREVAQERYSALAYYLSFNFILVPIEMLWDVMFILGVYFFLDLNSKAESFIKFTISAIISGMLGSGWGMMISIVSSSLEASAVWSMITLVPMWLCSGFLVNYTHIPDWFFLKWLSPYYFAFQAGIRAELEDLSGAKDYGTEALKNLNLPNDFNEAIILSCVLVILFRIANYLGLRFLYKFH
ncbi:hypothetical protein SteCoe_16370 [Stentor coeruleus]|uniref:ABC transporter domain-containing protein n=1 Tax=Stentor coeruleus TaxID=5963 RepID=A0A1R2C1H1_9CILI|nr:hypothetical protein SteCoe_16370 [Stentor coeruleus]